MIWTLGLTLILSILVFLPLGWLGFFLPKVLLAQLGLGVSFLFWRRGARPKSDVRAMSKKETAVLFYFFILLFFTVFSAAPLSSFFGVSQSMQGLVVYIVYFATFVLGLHLNKKHWHQLFNFLLLANLMVLFYGFAQLLGFDPLTYIFNYDAFLSRPFSSLGNPNWLAAYLLLSLGLCLHVLPNFKRKGLMYLLIFLNALFIFLTVSKAAILALIILLIAFLSFTKNKIFLIAFLVIVLPSALFYLFHFYGDFFGLLRSSFSRTLIWQDTLKMLVQWPFGHGLDLFRFFYPQFGSLELWQYEAIDAVVSNPHNQFLDLSFSIGVLGAVFFYVLIAVIVFPFLKKGNMLAWGVLVYLFSNLFGFEVFTNGLLFWLFISYFLAYHNDFKARGGLICLRWPMIFVLILSAVLSWRHLGADIVYQKALAEQGKAEYTQAINNFDYAIGIFPYDRVFLLQAAELLLAVQDADEGVLAGAEEYLMRIDRLSSGKDPDLPILEAWLAAKKADFSLMRQKIREAKILNPTSINTYKIARQIFVEIGDQKAALAELENIRSLLPYYWNKPEIPAGRIFQKNYSWLLELLVEGEVDD